MSDIIEIAQETVIVQISGIDNTLPIQIIEVSAPEGVLAVNGRAGFVTLNKADVSLNNVENISITGVSGYLQYQINNLDIGYASQNEINLLSGNVILTGSNLLNFINSLSGYTLNTFYPKTNPSGFITGIDLSSYATKNALSSTGHNLEQKINSLSGYANSNFGTISNLAATGSNLLSLINLFSGSVVNIYSTKIDLTNTGFNLESKINSLSGYTNSNFYPKNNPSGFVTGVDLSSYATISNLQATGSSLQNQINNLDLNYATDLQLSQTGSSLQSQIDSLSGNLISTGQIFNDKINNLSGSAVLIYGDQYIDGKKIFRDTVRIKDLYVTGTETIVNTTNTNVGNNYILINATGGSIDAGIFVVTGNGLTGINDTGAIIGYDVPANRWVFGNTSRNSDLNSLERIAGITDITSYSGFVNNNFYTINNPSGYITSSYVDPIQYTYYRTVITLGYGNYIMGWSPSWNGQIPNGKNIYLTLNNINYTTDYNNNGGWADVTLPTYGSNNDKIRIIINASNSWTLNINTNTGIIETITNNSPSNKKIIEFVYNNGWKLNPIPWHRHTKAEIIDLGEIPNIESGYFYRSTDAIDRGSYMGQAPYQIVLSSDTRLRDSRPVKYRYIQGQIPPTPYATGLYTGLLGDLAYDGSNLYMLLPMPGGQEMRWGRVPVSVSWI